MEILIKFLIELDGKCPDVEKYFLEGLEPVGAIVSDDYDPENDWAILINGYEIVDQNQIQRIEELEAEIVKRPAKPLYGEARSSLLKAMDNSANVDDAITKYKKLQERIEELERGIDSAIIFLKARDYIYLDNGFKALTILQALKGGK